MASRFSSFFLQLAFTFAMIALLPALDFEAQIIINEVSPFKGVTDGVGEDSDWIELLNASNLPVDLTGYHLSDNADNWDKWEIPELVLQPDERTIILASGDDKRFLAGDWQSLVVETDVWRYLPGYFQPPSDWSSLDFDDITWNLGPGGFGYGDDDDNTQITNADSYYLRKTFDLESLEELHYLLFHADYDDGYIAYLNGVEFARSASMNDVVGNYNDFSNDIHEALLYQGEIPEHVMLDTEQIQLLLNEGENVLAVQVHNVNPTSSDLSGRFFLSASAEEGTLDLDPAPAWIPEIYSLYHTNFKLSTGEPVILSDDEGNLVDFLDIDASLSFAMTMGKTEDGLFNVCVFDTPTPWESNEGSWCYDGIESAPEVSLESGWYNGSQTATLIPTSPTQSIHYSLNGDLPTTAHPYYFTPISIDESSVLSARAFSTANMLPSKPADITCIIDEDNHGLPVFSVITDSLNLWGFNEGIYVSGPNATENYPFFGSNFWEPWSKWSRLEYFDGNQELQAKAEFDLEIHGGWSRAEPQKSFRFDFKSIYTGSLNYPVLSRKPFIEEHGNLNIRNGGQRGMYDKIQDAVFSRVASKTHVHNSSYDPCIVYLNGAYWGVYGIREKIDEQYVEDNFEVDKSQVDLLNSWSVLAGTRSDFDQAYATLMNTSPQGENYYDLLDAEFEIQNYIDYFAFETYIQNQDWMGIAWGLNNTKLWRSQQNGKWSYVMYDTDLAFGLFGGQPDDNYLQYARTPIAPSQHSMLFDRNLENEQFKCDFANRYADLVNTIFQSSEFNPEVDELQLLIANAMPDHIERWEAPFSLGFWNSTVEQIKTYNALRVPTAREHVNSTLGFNGQVEVTLDVVPEGAGSIQISTISPENYPWQGIYFNGCPVNISVTANEGYDFDFWEENPFISIGEELNDSLLVNIQNSSAFVAHFSQCNSNAEVQVNSENNQLSYTSEGIELVEEVEWFLNGVPVGSGETFDAEQSGIYAVTITSGNCSYSSNELIFSYVGVGEIADESISIWPNPASHEIRITSPNMDLNSSILEIWSSSGQLVLREARPQSSISIAHLSAGMYQVKLSDGKMREVLMLLVE